MREPTMMHEVLDWKPTRLEENLRVKMKEMEGEWEALVEPKSERNEWAKTDPIVVEKIGMWGAEREGNGRVEHSGKAFGLGSKLKATNYRKSDRMELVICVQKHTRLTFFLSSSQE